LHGIPFVNNGRVLQFEPKQVLSYSHLSSISRLPDKPENYTVLDFQVASMGTQTSITLTVNNFPTESIYKHMRFYWNVTLEIFKKMLEQAG
jgi:activator of Hsp90 ATPase-like protein